MTTHEQRKKAAELALKRKGTSSRPNEFVACDFCGFGLVVLELEDCTETHCLRCKKVRRIRDGETVEEEDR